MRQSTLVFLILSIFTSGHLFALTFKSSDIVNQCSTIYEPEIFDRLSDKNMSKLLYSKVDPDEHIIFGITTTGYVLLKELKSGKIYVYDPDEGIFTPLDDSSELRGSEIRYQSSLDNILLARHYANGRRVQQIEYIDRFAGLSFWAPLPNQTQSFFATERPANHDQDDGETELPNLPDLNAAIPDTDDGGQSLIENHDNGATTTSTSEAEAKQAAAKRKLISYEEWSMGNSSHKATSTTKTKHKGEPRGPVNEFWEKLATLNREKESGNGSSTSVRTTVGQRTGKEKESKKRKATSDSSSDEPEEKKKAKVEQEPDVEQTPDDELEPDNLMVGRWEIENYIFPQAPDQGGFDF